MIPCRLKGEKMKKYQITYCLDGEVLFKTKNDSGYQLVANFLSANTKGDCIKCLQIGKVCYYEINMEKAIQIIKQKKQYDYNELERYLLSFIEAFLANTADELMTYLSNTNSYTKKELADIELEFERKKKRIKFKQKKFKTA